MPVVVCDAEENPQIDRGANCFFAVGEHCRVPIHLRHAKCGASEAGISREFRDAHAIERAVLQHGAMNGSFAFTAFFERARRIGAGEAPGARPLRPEWAACGFNNDRIVILSDRACRRHADNFFARLRRAM